MSDETLFSVCYRTGPITKADYDEAIEALQNARDLTDATGCPVCHDSHSAAQCHHNPLVLARHWAAATNVWACYHCGFVATNDQEALEHFGPANSSLDPKCLRDAEIRISSLAGMIMRMCRRLDRFDPDTKVRNQAVDLLKRYGLCSPLRTDSAPDHKEQQA